MRIRARCRELQRSAQVVSAIVWPPEGENVSMNSFWGSKEQGMIKGISKTADADRSLMGTIKARAEVKSAAFSELLGAADGKARQNKANPLSRITAHTVQNMTALFSFAPKAAGTHTAAAGALSFEQRATLAESTELLQTRTHYLRMALQLHNPGKALSAPALLKL
jgi:hypothetical protein